MPKLRLVRHAEPEVKGILLGRLDVGLSEEGLRCSSRALGALEGAIAYVSPLRRAQQTAAFLPPATPRLTLEDLTEIGLGQWEGKTWAEVETEWPELAARKLADWFAVAAPGGESFDQVQQRARRVWARLRSGPSPAIVVAHQGINAVLAAIVSGSDPRAFQQDYCAVFEYDY